MKVEISLVGVRICSSIGESNIDSIINKPNMGINGIFSCHDIINNCYVSCTPSPNKQYTFLSKENLHMSVQVIKSKACKYLKKTTPKMLRINISTSVVIAAAVGTAVVLAVVKAYNFD